MSRPARDHCNDHEVDQRAFDAADITTVLCDLDGVIWLAHRPIRGSAQAVSALRSSGRRVLFVTNNSASTRAQHETALGDVGIVADGDVVSSSMAAAGLIVPGERVLVAGGDGVVEALQERGAAVVRNDGHPTDGRFDAVVVGIHRDFDYARLDTAAAAVRAGARLIGTNEDSTFPTPRGLRPGAGPILAAVATASGVEPQVAGKPHEAMADLIVDMVTGPGDVFSGHRVLMVGDRLDTDGRFAQRLGCHFALVRSGVTSPNIDVPGMSTALDCADLAGVARTLVPGFPPGE